jgi:hypothetical protein
MGAPPYNKQVDRTKLARHAVCLRKRHAGTGPPLLLRRRAGPQALPLTWALYGLNKRIGIRNVVSRFALEKAKFIGNYGAKCKRDAK